MPLTTVLAAAAHIGISDDGARVDEREITPGDSALDNSSPSGRARPWHSQYFSRLLARFPAARVTCKRRRTKLSSYGITPTALGEIHMKSIRIAIAAGAIGLAGLAATTMPFVSVLAQDTSSTTTRGGSPHGGWGHHHGWGPMRAFHQLGLTDEQKASMKTILSDAAPAMKSLHQQIRTNMQQLRATTPESADYAAVVASVSQTAGTLETQKTTQQANLYAQLYAVLTPAQKSQLAALQAKWAAKTS
jgi:Spy/CpxP family protein refolding chaperone